MFLDDITIKNGLHLFIVSVCPTAVTVNGHDGN
jgi:hypothetical protein